MDKTFDAGFANNQNKGGMDPMMMMMGGGGGGGAAAAAAALNVNVRGF